MAAQKKFHLIFLIYHFKYLSFIILLSASLLGQIQFKKIAFDQPLRIITANIDETKKEYKGIEKSLQSFFPKGSRKSAFYLSIKKDFATYRDLIKQLDYIDGSLRENHQVYRKLFSTGFMKSVDIIRRGDNNWDKAEALASFLETTLKKAESLLNSIQPLYQQFTVFVKKMEEVNESLKEIESSKIQSKKAFERADDRLKQLQKEFSHLDTNLSQYSAYDHAKMIYQALQTQTENFSITMNSIHQLFKQLKQLIRGPSKSGEETEIWEIYKKIVEQYATLTTSIVEVSSVTKDLQTKFEDILKLLEEFGNTLIDMEDRIVELANRQKENKESLERDRSRQRSLIHAKPRYVSLKEFPYKDLKEAFRHSEEILVGTEQYISNAAQIRTQVIELAGQMKSLKGDEEKYEHFRNYKKEFDSIYNQAIKQYDDYQKAKEKFEEIILKNFMNTQEYWDILYAVEKKKSFSGNQTVEENFGYLFDINEYPDQPYYGKLISTYQLRLKKEKLRGQQDWTFTFIFEGSNDFPLEGLLLMNNDSVLFDIPRDQIDVIEEKRSKDGRVNFVWEFPVGKKKLLPIVTSENLILKIHFMTTSYQIVHTLYLNKFYKEYKIPSERIFKWREMVLEEKV